MNPATMRDYSPAGPGAMRCRLCGMVISTNALARAGHERGKRHVAAVTLGQARHALRDRRRELRAGDCTEADLAAAVEAERLQRIKP